MCIWVRNFPNIWRTREIAQLGENGEIGKNWLREVCAFTRARTAGQIKLTQTDSTPLKEFKKHLPGNAESP